MRKVEPSSHLPEVSLRPFRHGDLKAFWEWASDPKVTCSLMWEAYETQHEAEEFLVQVAEQHPWFMAICFQDEVVGSITLDKGKGAHSCKAELGYVVARRHWGKGLATAAITSALDVGFAALEIKRIEAYVDPSHEASYRALEKAGLTREGLLRCAVVHKGVVKDRYLYAKVIRSV